jgi:hypothetical protein
MFVRIHPIVPQMTSHLARSLVSCPGWLTHLGRPSESVVECGDRRRCASGHDEECGHASEQDS